MVLMKACGRRVTLLTELYDVELHKVLAYIVRESVGDYCRGPDLIRRKKPHSCLLHETDSNAPQTQDYLTERVSFLRRQPAHSTESVSPMGVSA